MRLAQNTRAAKARPSGWIPTDTTRLRARSNAVLRHPLKTISSLFLHKRGIAPLAQEPSSADDILQKTADLPISVWTYGFDHASVRHLGPMAQDFARAFGLGSSDRRIDMIDANGVSLACIQALYRRVLVLEGEVAELRAAAASRNGESAVGGAGNEPDAH